MNKAYIDVVISEGQYRGIERTGKLLLILKRKKVEQYLSMLDENGRIPFSDNNLFALMHLNEKIIDHEVIVYGEHEVVFPENVKSDYLGYDVSGDSMYLSPLFTAFFGNNGGSYFKELQSKLSTRLNEYGLFDSRESVDEFIEVVNASKCDGVFEKDGQLKPVYVYRV